MTVVRPAEPQRTLHPHAISVASGRGVVAFRPLVVRPGVVVRPRRLPRLLARLLLPRLRPALLMPALLVPTLLPAALLLPVAAAAAGTGVVSGTGVVNGVGVVNGAGAASGAVLSPAADRRGEHRIELRRQTLEMHRSWRDAPAVGGAVYGGPVLRGSMVVPAPAPAARPADPLGSPVLDGTRTPTPVHPLNEPQDGDPAAARLTESERDLLRRQLRQRLRTPSN